MEWKQLASDYQGSHGTPGSQYHVQDAIVETNGQRFRVRIQDRWGSNQGYLQEHGRADRQYRGDSLDELMRVAMAAEQHRPEPDQNIMTAIREAIYQAEDALAEQKANG